MPKKVARAARRITKRRAMRQIVPDADYVADLEITDSQRSKRMASESPVSPPSDRSRVDAHEPGPMSRARVDLAWS
jgi:hypothetical protein